MMNVLLRVSDAIDGFRQRIGRNVFWLVLVAALAAVLVVPLLMFQDPSPVTMTQPVSKGEVRPAIAIASKPAPAAPGLAEPTAPSSPTPAPASPAPAPASPAPAAPAPGLAGPPPPALAPAAPATSPAESAPAAPVTQPAPAMAATPAPAPAAAPTTPPTKAPAPAAPTPTAPPPLTLSDSREPEPAPPAAAAASAEPEKVYQVQLGAFASEQRAHRLARLSAKEGFPAVLMRVTVAGKVLHRVRLKASLPREQAEALQADVKQKIPSLDPILVAGKR